MGYHVQLLLVSKQYRHAGLDPASRKPLVPDFNGFRLKDRRNDDVKKL
jgi:hypothetical protein